MAEPSPALDHPGLDHGTHVYPLRVYFEDTDAGGVIYYANYLRFAERARTELLRELGIDQVKLWDRDGVIFAVRRCLVDYLAPGGLDDVLEVRTRILAASAATIEAEQIVRRPSPGNGGGSDLARLEVKLACINRKGRPVRLPKNVVSALQPFSQSTPKTKRA